MIEIEGDQTPSIPAMTFDEFYELEWRSIVALAYSLCGSTGMASDVAQDAFVAAFDRWSDITNPGAWIRQVVANKSVSTLRRKASETKALLRLRLADETTPPIDHDAEQLWSDVRSLPKRQAQVIALRYLDGSSVEAIADVLGLSQNTVKTHLKRGRATLAARSEESS